MDIVRFFSGTTEANRVLKEEKKAESFIQPRASRVAHQIFHRCFEQQCSEPCISVWMCFDYSRAAPHIAQISSAFIVDLTIRGARQNNNFFSTRFRVEGSEAQHMRPFSLCFCKLSRPNCCFDWRKERRFVCRALPSPHISFLVALAQQEQPCMRRLTLSAGRTSSRRRCVL